MINRNSLIDMFGDTVYRRGLEYYNKGRVNDLFYDEVDGKWYANVIGTEVYEVEITFLQSGISYSCDCPAHFQYDGCKHIVAVALEILDEMNDEPKRKMVDQFLDRFEQIPDTPRSQGLDLTTKMINLFSSFIDSTNEAKSTSSITKKPLTCEYYLKVDEHAWNGSLLTLEMKMGIDRLYVVKKMKELINHVEEQRELIFTPNFIYDPKVHYFQEVDLEIMNLLIEINRSDRFYHEHNDWGIRSSNQKGITIPPLFADRLLQLLMNQNCKLEHHPRKYDEFRWSDGPLPFKFHLEQEASSFFLDLHFLNNVLFFEEYGYILVENTLYKLTSTQQELLEEMQAIVNKSYNRTLPIERDQIDTFLSHVMPGLNKLGDLEITETVSNTIIQPPLQAKLYLDLIDERLYASLEYHYNEYTFYPFGPQQSEQTNIEQILIRDIEKEQEIMNLIESASFKYNGHELYIEDEEDIFTFIYDYLPSLEDEIDIFMTGQVRNILLEERQYPKVNVNLDHNENFLEINFDFDDINHDEVANIFKSLTEKKRFYRLPNGAFVPLQEEAFSPISKLFEELNIKGEEIQAGKLSLPAYRSMQVEDFLNKETGAKYNKAFRQLIQDMKNPDEKEYPIPPSLKADLREYQNVGFQWLKTLSHYHFGGILADDMGLGKTIQTIAFLLSLHEEKQDNHAPALVISPASLIYNWKSEFDKFAPSLNVLVVSGGKDEREKQLQTLSADKIDVVVTSYPLVRQDTDMYQTLEFSSLILDEAQAIKNDATKTARAVKAIKAGKRFALSGTPIENSLTELWSIFDAILPGFFPSKKKFSSMDQKQIARMSRPFILRRLKQDVLKELPDKIETVHMSDLTKEQKQLYLGYLEKIQGEAASAIATEGFQRSRMKILAGLTRLRQLCCHPSLFIENYHGESGKLTQLLEMIDNALENGQRLLIFSQFSSMLQIIRDVLKKQGKEPFYLDGQTPSQNRVEMANRFNNGERDIFLISLKAGGTGLNLTGADTVILYDLWWNPAVEEQATGRAHRMGQKKVVQVFRLIAKGTIEEKIYALQQKKKELIDNVIQPGEAMFNKLTEEEIRDLLSV